MEKAILIKTYNKQPQQEIDADIEEMKGLIDTAGGELFDIVMQKKEEISPSHYIGKGKAEEIAAKYSRDIDLAVFDADLKPVQVRNLENVLNVRVIDRTQLIVDIFAGRANTREGKLQVEYAQLSYLLPRLTGKGVQLSRVGGSAGGGRSPIGTRGPGETKLETDKRKIRNKLTRIKEELNKVKDTRSRQRQRRKSVPVPLIALVGYTNVGKTMFLNKMTDAGQLSENKLFATLDSKIKSYELPGGYKVLFSDTVGFIKNLPTQLVAAFRGTLEEVKEADIILHFMDISDESHEKHRDVVNEILESIGAYEESRIIEVFNKVDLVDEEEKRFLLPGRKGIYISAFTGEGIDTLVMKIKDVLEKDFIQKEIVVDQANSGFVKYFYDEGVVLKRKEVNGNMVLTVSAMKKTFDKFEKMVKEDYNV